MAMTAEALRSTMEKLASINASIEAKNSEQTKATSAQIAAQEQANTAQKVIDAQQGADAMEANNRTKIQGADLGADPSKANYLIAQLTQSKQHHTQEMLKQQQVIEHMDSLKFSDSPLEWLQAQFTINDEIQSHNDHLAAAKESGAAIDDISANMTSLANTNSIMTKTIDKETLAASLEVKAQTANAVVAGLRANASETDIKNQALLKEGYTNIVAQHYNAKSLEMQQQAFAQKKAQDIIQNANTKRGLDQTDTSNTLARERYNHDAMLQDYNLAKDKVAVEEKATMLKAVNNGLTDMGEGTINQQTFEQLGNNTVMQAKFAKAFAMGNTGTIGSTPSESLHTIETYNLDYRGTPRQEVVTLIRDVAKDVKLLNAKELNALHGEAYDSRVRELINTGVNDKSLEGMRNPEAPNSVYGLGSINNILKQNPTLMNTSLYRGFLKTQIETNNPNFEAEAMVHQIEAAYTTGAIKDKALAYKEMYQFIQAGIATNNVQKKYDTMGLLPQTTYMMVPSSRPWFFQKLLTKALEPERIIAPINIAKSEATFNTWLLTQRFASGIQDYKHATGKVFGFDDLLNPKIPPKNPETMGTANINDPATDDPATMPVPVKGTRNQFGGTN